MNANKVSVVLPVYKGESTLEKALDSLIDPTVKDLEILVLDDGSPDRSRQLAERFAANSFPTIVRIYSHPNQGLAATLNRGLSLAKGEFIARQDQDDIVLPGRLYKQLAFLESHPDVAIVGTWAHIYDGDIPSKRYHRHPAADDALRLELLFDNPFVHSSVMMRANVVRELGGYCEDLDRQPPEDYELWSRIARRHRVANIPEVLTIYREISGSMSRLSDNPFQKNVVRISSENLAHVLKPDFSLRDCLELAKCHHGLPFEGGLSRQKARCMLEAAASSVGGIPKNWSEEFRWSHARMHRQIDSRFLKRRIPTPLLGLARWLKRILRSS